MTTDALCWDKKIALSSRS